MKCIRGYNFLYFEIGKQRKMFKKRILFFLLVCVVPVAVPFFGCGKKSDPEDPLEERLRQERLEAEKKAAELRASKPKNNYKARHICM